MVNLEFSIKRWSAWSPDKSASSDWIKWANENINPDSGSIPDISQIPAMKRRRMSSLSKMALSTALDCLNDIEQKPNCVFASQHGELERTIKIINTLVNNDDVSPTDFSLSVHNTALGLFSIQTANKMPATTIAAGEDTFAYAMLEACNLLKRYPESPVLLVFFDQPLPYPLSSLEDFDSEAISISLLITLEKTSTISMDFEYMENQNPIEYTNLGLKFLKFLLTDDPSVQVQTSRMNWCWSRA